MGLKRVNMEGKFKAGLLAPYMGLKRYMFDSKY